MAFDKTWVDAEGKPTNANYGYEIDDYMRTLAYAVRERMAVEHNWFADETGQSNIAMHKIVTLLVQTTITALADAGKIYTKDVAGKAELHFTDEDANVIQLTSVGKILGASISGIVDLTTAQVIAGVKTFSDNIILTKANITTTKYTTGNVAVTNGSTAVVGTGTLWAANTKAGQAFQRDGDTKYYIISSVTDDTHLALTANYDGVTGTGLAYEIAETVDGMYVAKLLKKSEYAGFGAWASKSNNTSYLADTDGFVCAYASPATSVTVYGYTDSSNPPTTARVGDSHSYEAGSGPGGITMPVKKGDYWKVSGANAVYWLPLGT